MSVDIDDDEKKFVSLFTQASMNGPLTVFDVGAHKGAYTAYFNQMASVSAKCHLFDPLPDMYAYCVDQFSGNASIAVNNIALGNMHGSSKFYRVDGGLSGSSCYYRREVFSRFQCSQIQVEMTSLDRYVAERDIAFIDLLKIDTEGSDLAVLQGAQNALADKKIGFIQFEYGGTWHDAGISIISATELLDNLGYQVYEFLSGVESFREIEFKSDDYQYRNLYACRKGQMPFALA
jgi:FkbM family methyltransferase